MEMVTVRNIQNHGDGPICRGVSGKEVSKEYILEYRTNCMLSRVWRQVIECVCMMGPCQRRLSLCNFRSILGEILQEKLIWSSSRKMCSEVPAMMTFVSRAGGDME